MRWIPLSCLPWTLACVTTFVVDSREDRGTTQSTAAEGSSHGSGDVGEGSTSTDPPGSCDDDRVRCDDDCADLSKDADHCGECGIVCADDEACDLGQCTTECSEGRSICDRKCVDVSSDSRHCGGCDVECGDHAACSDAECVCQLPFTGCGDRCVYLPSDPDHCGMCFQTCAGQACGSGQCQPDGCPEGTMACGLSCADVSDNPLHCGACGDVCDHDDVCVDGDCREAGD